MNILLSCALTLLFITSNNASYAAPHYTDFSGNRLQGNKPNMNNGVRFNPNRNRLGDDISGYGYRNIFNNRILPNKSGVGRFDPISKYSISDEPAFIPKPAFRINQSNDDASGLGYRGAFRKGNKLHDSVHCINNSFKQIDGKNFACKNNKWLGPLGGDGVFIQGVNERSGVIIGDNHFIGKNIKAENTFGGQEGEAFNPTSKYSISDEPAFIPKPDINKDSALGPDVVTTLEHGPGVINQPEGVPLRFINGEWVEPLANVDLQNTTEGSGKLPNY